MTVKGNCDRRNGGVHRGTPARHRGQGKGTRKGALGRTGQTQKAQGLGKTSRGEALGRTGADPAPGKSFLGRSAGQHRGEPSRHRGLGILTR